MTNFFSNSFFGDSLLSLDWDDTSWKFKSITNSFPFCDIWVDSKDTLNFDFSLAGYDKNSLSISVDRGLLIVSHPGQSTEDKNYIQKGIKKAGFEKVFKLGDGYSDSDPIASFNEGILHIEIPRDETKKKKIIKVD